MENLTLNILIKHLPDIFPTAGFEYRFFELTGLRKVQPFIKKAETKEKWSKAGEKVHFEQAIQTQIFDRYSFEVIVNDYWASFRCTECGEYLFFLRRGSKWL